MIRRWEVRQLAKTRLPLRRSGTERMRHLQTPYIGEGGRPTF
jgi:hypothetical protein